MMSGVGEKKATSNHWGSGFMSYGKLHPKKSASAPLRFEIGWRLIDHGSTGFRLVCVFCSKNGIFPPG
jgi:hypothetical protein